MTGLRVLAALAVAAGWSVAQTPANAPVSLLNAKDANLLATRAGQLMESTAAAVPGLSAASEALRRAAEQSVAQMRGSPQNAVLTNQFVSQVRAFLAMSEAFA